MSQFAQGGCLSLLSRHDSSLPPLGLMVDNFHKFTELNFQNQYFLPQKSTSWMYVQFSSVAQSCPTLCDPMNCSMPPCPSPPPRVHSDSRPSSPWCHPGISSSVIPFSSFPQSLPVSVFSNEPALSALASFLPKNTQGWSPSEWIGWISLV